MKHRHFKKIPKNSPKKSKNKYFKKVPKNPKNSRQEHVKIYSPNNIFKKARKKP
jgi:hypothetical protein